MLDARLQETFNLFQNAISMKHNKMRYACTINGSFKTTF